MSDYLDALDLLAASEQRGEQRDRQAMHDAREMLIKVKQLPAGRGTVLALALYSAIEHCLPRSAEVLARQAEAMLADSSL